MTKQTLEEAAKTACLQIGIDYKDVPSDGNFHPANISDDPRGKGDGRLKLFPDRQGAIAWNHKSGEKQTFFINRNKGVPISSEEKERIRKEKHRRKKGLKARQDKAAKRAQVIWKNAKPAPPDHPYLLTKHVLPYFTRQASWDKSILGSDGQWKKITLDNVLLIPLFNEAGGLRNLQAIFPEMHPELDRNKDFLAGAELSGLFSWVGNRTDTLAVVEGMATAFTIHQETGFRCYIAFTANNLLAVGQIIRKHLPTSKIIFCADNDKNTKGNPGITKATEAAAIVGGFVASPPLAGDFNDYYNYLQEVK